MPRSAATGIHTADKHPAARAVTSTAGAKKTVHVSATQKKQAHMLDQIGKVNGSGWYLPWYKRDPRRPDGPPISVLLAEAQTGEIRKRGGTPEIVLHGVNAKLFQNGVHAANVLAANVRADQQADKVFGSGGCRVTSLVNPADTVLTSDRLTWDIAHTRIVAQGHAHVERRPKNGGIPITQDGGTIVYDLEHNTVTVQ